ncbi:MAG: FAD:protein FMN transferase, partial [Planctomycetota bacterium]|nr:FAD:protein FMN transferase [Planctomycetota bacterium]
MAGDPGSDGVRPLRTFILPALFVLALFVTLWARRPAPATAAPQWELMGQAFGTSYKVKVIPGSKESDREAILKAIEAEVADVNSCMSTWIPDSELSKLNRNTKLGPVPVSPMLAEVLVESAKVHKLSGGAFDITIGPLVKVWGFGREKVVEAPTLEAL